MRNTENVGGKCPQLDKGKEVTKPSNIFKLFNSENKLKKMIK